MIKNKYRHIGRYRNIIKVFAKNGFESILDQIGLLKYLHIKKSKKDNVNDQYKKMTIGERLRISLEELGPTFVKLGQILSTRPDFIPNHIIKELEKLQTNVPAFSFDEVNSIIESEFGEKINQLYKNFENEPLAAASIAQVHRGKLHSGEDVVVKIQRPGIENIIELDIKILKDIAAFISNKTKFGKTYDYKRMADELDKSIKKEVDFRIEGANAERLSKNIKKNEPIKIPKVFWELTTRKIITMEYISGSNLNDIIEDEKINKTDISRKITYTILNQILRDGFFHADPHPGNIKILNSNQIALIDFGMVGELDENKKSQFIKMLMGIVFKNSKFVIQSLTELSVINSSISFRAMAKEIESINDRYLSVQLEDIKLGQAFNEIFRLAQRYKLIIPGEFVMLAKTLITLEGVVEKLNSEISILEIAEPITNKLVFKLFSPKRFSKSLLGDFFEYRSLFKDFPSIAQNFLLKLEENDYTIQFSFKELKQVEKRINRIFSRISYSIVLLAISIVIAGIMIGLGLSVSNNTQMYVLNMTVLKITIGIAILVVVALIYNILK
ncbi:MAG: AarF/UbiB family protein [Clostridiales bacterium]